MSDKDKTDLDNFMLNRFDFGTKPEDYPLSEDRKKLAAFAMAVNAALVTFILEGLLPADQQLHFMGHMQDFMQRIYEGEDVKLDGVSQTLQVNSKAGTLFFEATNSAFTTGSKNFNEIKRLAQEYRSEARANENVPSEAKPKYLN